jgi:hypothetical protein
LFVILTGEGGGGVREIGEWSEEGKKKKKPTLSTCSNGNIEGTPRGNLVDINYTKKENIL